MKPDQPPSPSYWSSFGPLDGPIPDHPMPPCLGVLPAPVEGQAPHPVGIAYPAGAVRYGRGLAAVFRLEIGKKPIPGRWVCVGRRFVEIGEAAE